MQVSGQDEAIQILREHEIWQIVCFRGSDAINIKYRWSTCPDFRFHTRSENESAELLLFRCEELQSFAS